MTWHGPCECPSCHAPLDVDASVCPYCFSSPPATAPWNVGGDHRPLFIGLFAVSGLVLLALGSDQLLGTTLIPQMLQWLSQLREQ